MATADVFESVLGSICTGILRVPSDEGNELKRSLEVCMLACRLEMEELEWCAVGKVEEYFEANKNAYLPQAAIRYVLHNTQSTSHLHEWLATHVASRLSTGAMCAEALEGVIATAHDFATRIIISMQTTVVEITGALLDMEFSEIRKARSKVMRDSNYDGNSAMDDDERDDEMDEDEERDDEMSEDEMDEDEERGDEMSEEEESEDHSSESSGDY